MIRDIREIEGKDPTESDPDSNFVYVNAAHRLRGTLTRWVEEWRRTKRPPLDEDRENYVAEYIYENAKLRDEFVRTTKQMGLADEVFRQLLAFQPSDRITGPQQFRLRVAIFRDLVEASFLSSYSSRLGVEFATTFFSSNNPLLGADAEAIHLFIILLRSGLSAQLRRCPASDCGKFFLNLGGRREFCSRSHAQQRINRQVLQSLKQTRDKQKQAALARANKALQECTSSDWKWWVAKRTGLTATFLTRNIDSLKVPKRFGREER